MVTGDHDGGGRRPAGAFTTFSTFGYETFTLLRTGRGHLAAAYVVLSLLGGLAATALGYVAGRAVA